MNAPRISQTCLPISENFSPRNISQESKRQLVQKLSYCSDQGGKEILQQTQAWAQRRIFFKQDSKNTSIREKKRAEKARIDEASE